MKINRKRYTVTQTDRDKQQDGKDKQINAKDKETKTAKGKRRTRIIY
jgi:hypothetical protein